MRDVCEPPTSSDLETSALIQGLGSHDPTERERLRKLIIERGHGAVIPLLHALKSSSETMCWEAVKALAEIRDPAAANALAEALDHDQQSVRWVAAEGLVALGPEGLKQALVALLTRARSNWVRDGAHHVISHFAHQMRWKFLLPMLKQFDGYQPAVTLPPAALRALHVLQDRTVVRTE